MKRIISAVLVWTLAGFADASCSKFSQLTDHQLQVLRHSFSRGAIHDLGFTLAAIAWVESDAGLLTVNMRDPSFGVHQININTAIRRSGFRDTDYFRNLLAQQLLSWDVSADYALLELEFWRKVHRNDWRKMVASYNAGHEFENGRPYLDKIRTKLRLLESCHAFWLNPAQSADADPQTAMWLNTNRLPPLETLFYRPPKQI